MSSVHSARYKRFLRRLRAARRELGMTQAQVARAFGRPQSFVSKCESGERRVDVLELGEFAELYGRPLSFFVAEGERATSGAGMTRDAATRRRRKPAAPRRRKS